LTTFLWQEDTQEEKNRVQLIISPLGAKFPGVNFGP
jgi:hypothetical protein